ncbi:ABC transporter substrate-binding protein [Mycobacterium sp. 21AC1]|uniref:ABC transporter substrate-binding protein n=1 Tax=[Mycobacterium] appelbergii TaxID=2939269 RepID=UPI0029391BFE|nr:ABC transporter substrate-binding protein [Mycobacterium sp. 21AC1]MDV3130219.1 ABC transporter substrate-binding protein [Mycobacterium sp. 21AC1]
MSMKRSVSSALASSAVVVGLLAGCSGSDGGDANPDDPVKIDITVTHDTEPFSVPWLVAIDQGFFKERGVEVGKIVPGKGGASTIQNQLSGDLPIADTSFPAVVDAKASGADLVVVGGAVQSLAGNDFYALAGNDAVNSVKDVKVWSFTREGSVTQQLTYLLPDAEGVDPNSVQRTTAGGLGEGLALLEGGDVDATVVPIAEALKNPDAYKLVVSAKEVIPAFQQTVMTTTPEYAQQHPKVIEAITNGYDEAVQWTVDHPKEAAAIWAKHTKESDAVAERIVQSYLQANYWGVGFNAEAIANALKGFQLVGKDASAVDLCELFDPQYLPDGASTTASENC